MQDEPGDEQVGFEVPDGWDPEGSLQAVERDVLRVQWAVGGDVEDSLAAKA